MSKIDSLVSLNNTSKESLVEINEEIYCLTDYLPILLYDENENEYIQTLFKALTLSYSNGLYQFAYIQLHMIFMVSVYYMLLKVYALRPAELENALFYMMKDRVRDFFGKSHKTHERPYFGSFASLNESDVFLLLKIAGIDSDLQGELKKLVEERNKYAHANGNLTITTSAAIDEKISKYINSLDRLQILLKPLVLELYTYTLTSEEFYDIEIRAGSTDDDEQIQEEIVKKYYLSKKDLNICRKCNLKDYTNKKGFSAILNLHKALCKYYKELS